MLEVDIKSRRGDFSLTAMCKFKPGVSALIGVSGVGKSSLLRLIAGLDRPENGTIIMNGMPWFQEGKSIRPTHKRQIGMVFQSGLLLPHRSVLNNIELGAGGANISKNLLEQTGCDRLLARPVGGLSGGEQQRVMLARALAGNPKLLLLDEPLSALDFQSRLQIQEMMAQLFAQLKIPVVYVTHTFEEAARLTDNFVLMQNGTITAEGRASEVLGHVPATTQELAISSVIEGRVSLVEKSGMAKVQIGRQYAQIARGGVKNGDRVYLRLWARDIILAHKKPQGISARNMISGHVKKLSDLANGHVLVEVSVEGQNVSALVLSQTAMEMKLVPKLPIYIIFKSASVEHIRS